MKNRTITPVVMIFCLMIAPFGDALPQARKTQEASKRFKLRSQPELGMKLPFNRRLTTLLMTGSARLEPAYDVEHHGLEFTVCPYRDMLIHYVSTNDPRFITSEGIAVGESLKRVLEISKGELITESGWAFYVSLKSGWSAAFVQGESMTEGELLPDAKVNFLFKR
jgi:hypothetical protein